MAKSYINGARGMHSIKNYLLSEGGCGNFPAAAIYLLYFLNFRAASCSAVTPE